MGTLGHGVEVGLGLLGKNLKSISRKKGISKSHRSVRLEARSRLKSKSIKSKPQSVRASRRKSSSYSGHDTVSDSGSEDLSMPYRRPKPIPFTSTITHFRYHRRAKLSPNVRVYEGNKDPEDHLSIFFCRNRARGVVHASMVQDVPPDPEWVILPKKFETIYDAPLGFVSLYTHHFSLSNLRLPIPLFICDVLNYFKIDFKSFMIQGVDGEFNFLSEGGFYDNQGSMSAKSVNNKTPIIDAEPISIVLPLNVADNIIDSSNTSSDNELPQVRKAHVQASKVVGDASTPLDVDSDPDIHEFPSTRELKDATDYHWVIAHVTPPS
ncbi:hypothetical protein Tco_0422248 [Tanacetum coccineum]